MKVIVIGAGLGGLAAAARLAAQGHDVELHEAADGPGGRAGVIRKGGYSFDTGPTMLMMPDTLHDTFSACGRRLGDYLQLTRLATNYRVKFGDGGEAEVAAGPQLAERLSSLGGRPEGLEQFKRRAGGMYALRPSLIDRNFDRMGDFITPQTAYRLWRLGGLKRLSRFAQQVFGEPRLAQLFSFQSMYLGLSPRSAAAVYSMIAYTELAEGIWFPAGGVYRVAEALERLARDCGVSINYCSRISRITVTDGRADGVILESGEYRVADAVVSNADISQTYRQLMQRPPMKRRLGRLHYSSSALVWMLGVKHPLSELGHHNFYLSRDFESNLDDIFHHHRLSDDPSMYFAVPSKTDPSLAPAGRHNLYVLVPMSNLKADIDWEAGIAQTKQRALQVLSQRFGADIAGSIETEATITPADFAARFGLPYGAAFGLTHHFFQSGWWRPANRAPGVRGLFLVGASTVPGSGVPMVLISGRLAAERVASYAA